MRAFVNRKSGIVVAGLLLFAASGAQAQTAPDPALETYVSLARMLALNERCHWLDGRSVEYLGLHNAHEDRLAWLTASGKVLAATMATQNLPQVVASLPSCTDKQGEEVAGQIRTVAGQVAVQWILRAYILQTPRDPRNMHELLSKDNFAADALDAHGRPQWFHGLETVGEHDKLGEVVLGLKKPALHNAQSIAWVEAQQQLALADALRWARFSCKPWKGGIYYDAGTCPAIPQQDAPYRDYAQHWVKLANDMAMRISYQN